MIDTIIEGEMSVNSLIELIIKDYVSTDNVRVWIRIRKVLKQGERKNV